MVTVVFAVDPELFGLYFFCTVFYTGVVEMENLLLIPCF